MRRIALKPRRDWKARAEAVGFTWHHADGRRYWDERAYYAFTLSQVEDHIEAASAELHRLCLELVAEVVESPALMTRLAIPPAAQAVVAASWKARDPSLYGRFDFFYDGAGPPKLYEYNADTPTSIYEAAVFQWLWLEDRIADGGVPKGADQFNSLYDKLRERFAAIFPKGGFVHFASDANFVEDRQTVRFLEDVAGQAGIEPKFVALDQIGLDADGRFVDAENFLIGAIFKLYPWEEMFRDTYAEKIAASRTQFIEPAWKAVLSNKGLLPLLWERHAGHPNLLETYFDDDPRADGLGRSFVRKPLFSREGANVELYDKGRRGKVLDQGYGAEGWIRQALQPPPRFGANYPVVGSWMIGDDPAGMGIREDRGRVTRDRSRFVPHVILETAEVIPIRRGS
ncbi:glutathionylspermidine synthase family protein [Phenylobacterium sp. LH3H17]|uniref:glutathionylspermidine synthase family protein n=1 Tax=Phenylobacterium sp. LH3H17 TaxID=2903901 RepID=UPI0020C97F80|nr:glutathionylspermidine synthase family protein [Phenylobacterium sp. LH3H17]UTP40853.1 glutathionylspermidine synthase family protein [Phenylobacterium sp. LH3H17]